MGQKKFPQVADGIDSSPLGGKELGDLLRKLRGKRNRSLRELEKASWQLSTRFTTSRSQLQRIEAGKVIPKKDQAEFYDQLYGGQGKVADLIRRLCVSSYDPWLEYEQAPKESGSYCWDARYVGFVTILLWPTVQNVATEHTFEISWGPWRYHGKAILDKGGMALWTEKARDENGVATPLLVHCDKPIFTEFVIGKNDPPDAQGRDIRGLWHDF